MVEIVIGVEDMEVTETGLEGQVVVEEAEVGGEVVEETEEVAADLETEGAAV